MLTGKGVCVDKMHGGVIIRKIVGHFLDLALNAGEICALLRNDKYFAGVLFTGGQRGILTGAHGFQRGGNGHGVLACILNAFDAAHCVRVALADAAAPEGIVLAVRQDAGGIQAVEGEHAGIPAAGDDADFTGLFRGGIYVCKMRRDACMGVKAVDHVEKRCIFGSLLGQVGGAAAADHQYVDLVLHGFRLIRVQHLCACGSNMQVFRCAAGENGL